MIIELSFINKKLWDKEDLFHRLPMKYQKIIKYSIENPEKIFNEYSREYSRVILQRGLLIYALWHPLLKIKKEEFIFSIRKTGHGWRKAYKDAIYQNKIEDFLGDGENE